MIITEESNNNPNGCGSNPKQSTTNKGRLRKFKRNQKLQWREKASWGQSQVPFRIGFGVWYLFNRFWIVLGLS